MSDFEIIETTKESECELINENHRRIHIVFFTLLSILVILVLRVVDLSVLNFNDEYFNVDGVDVGPLHRKNIVDRNGIVIASSLPTLSAYIYPKHFVNDPQSFSLIAKELDINIEDIQKKIIKNKSFVWLKRHLKPKQQQKVHDLGIPGIYLINDTQRIYPHKSLFSHTLGLVNVDGVGISGMELYFDKYLTDSEDTSELQISLDSNIQHIVKNELEKTVKLHDAVGGTAIVMELATGEIISSVSLPDFDPHKVINVNDTQLFNQAAFGLYEMGSVFKVLTLAMALDLGKVNVNDAFDISKPIKINNFTISDYRGGKGGVLSVPEILMYSSNIGTAHMVKEVGIKKQKEYFKKFGFFSKTDVELPERSRALYPSDGRWKEINSITMSYGHGISMTPIHFMQAFSSVVNNGKFKKATYIKGANDNIESRQVIKESTSKIVNKILRLTTKSGFSKRANINEYVIGAKTGTSEKIVNGKYHKKLNIAICAAAFPINKPEYAILVLVDEPKPNKINYGFATGGMVAAPVISDIVSKIAPMLNVAPIDHTNSEFINTMHVNYNARLKSR
ncbi:MAG: cell division protein FtsI (penicillin-binding protein 3) [Candidatus Midichloriaceae bacterium]|jgi:cell division protein FtsI (penicillin-binding protein 3)